MTWRGTWDAAARARSEGAAPPSLVFSGLHTVATSVVSIPIGIVGSVMVARLLGPKGKGGYDLILASAGLIGMALGLQLSSGVTYVTARGTAAIGSLACRFVSVALLQGIVALAVVVGIWATPFASAVLPSGLEAYAVAAIAICVMVNLLQGYGRAVLLGLQRIPLLNWLDLANRVLFVLAVACVCVLAGTVPRVSSPLILVSINIALGLIGFVTVLGFLWSWGVLRRGDPSTREVVAYSIPNYFGDLVQFLNYRLDVFVVAFFTGTKGVGLYVLAVNLAQLVWTVSQAASKVLFPRVASSQVGATSLIATTARATRMILWVNVFLAAGLGLVAAIALPVLYGDAFRGSVVPVFFLLPGIVVFGIVNVLAAYIAGIGKPRLNLYVATAGLFVTALLDFGLIPKFGISGAALASTASYAVSAVLTVWVFVRLTSVRIRELLIPSAEDFLAVRSLIPRLARRAR